MAHAFNSSTREAEGGIFLEFKASLVFKLSSRTGSKATQRNPVSKNQKGLGGYIESFMEKKKKKKGFRAMQTGH